MFVVVRHSNTFEAGEPPRRIGARTDLPLTAKGTEQARALGRHFADEGWRFTRVLASPLRRTRETAAGILAAQPDPAPAPQDAEFLREIDHGPDENAREDAVLARIGQAALAAWDDRAEPPPGWIVDAEARLAAWRVLFAGMDAETGPVLLVTSNGAARFALMADPALQRAAAALPSLKLATGSYGVIARDRAGELAIHTWGAVP
ncbi:histidine phosphatase family protein [Pelagerythrobacter sp.]|uniref:histidine phosphatase family protein n=1 Tax=Pelagerythrobacter sp. TaxID=2800702 RepID=UPI0035B2FA2F